jgi:hypothetical protein
VSQPDAVVLELDKLLVELEQFLRAQVALGKKLLLGMGENLLPMAHDN